MNEKPVLVTANMSVLDVVSTYRGIEETFKKYDQQAGICICCQALFDPLEKVARQFNLDLAGMVEDLSEAASIIVNQQ